MQKNRVHKLPVSVFLIAQDEADRIGEALDSVREWADEVIVVDSGSSDATLQVAREHGARTLYHEWDGYGKQKRFGEEQCRNPWIFNLDADERVTPELAGEIAALFEKGDPAKAGYRVRIVDIYPHETKPRPLASHHIQIRLYDKRQGRFSASPVHDAVHMAKDKVGMLRHIMSHYSFRSITHQLDKTNYYTDMQVRLLTEKNRTFTALGARLYLELPLCFAKAYFLRKHFLHGIYGFIASVNYAYFRFVRLAKYYERTRLTGKGGR